MPSGKLSESTFQRELIKYLPSFPFPSHHPAAVPASSQDPTLTALAQLGVLRLRASRCFISLFDRSHQYILAEATPSLSLQSDEVYEHGDRLWYGSTALRRHAGPCSVLVDRHIEAIMQGTDRPEPVTVIPDLRQHSEMGATDFMGKNPMPRFYAGIALESSRGAIIGSYCILDDEPRASLDSAQLRFLKDMASTVLSNLANSQVREEYRQGERLMRGIGSFVEGRGSLRNWRAMTGHDERSYEPSRAQYGGEGQLDKRQQAIQAEQDSAQTMSSMDWQAPDLHQDEPPSPVNRFAPTETSSQPGRQNSFLGSFQRPSPLHSHHVRSHLPDSATMIFARACNIIRECLEVEGAVFYETTSRDHSSVGSPADSSTPDSEGSDTGLDLGQAGLEQRPQSVPEKGDRLCTVIAFSDSQSSSVNDEKSAGTFTEFPEKFLKSLVRRFPQGNIFHFDNVGNLSSGSSEAESQEEPVDAGKESLGVDEEGGKKPSSPKKKKKKRVYRPQDGSMLSKLFPGARSIGFVPLWDSHKEKWHAGGFIWTKQPNRSFTQHGHLSFLEAIGSILMAEFARLNAVASDQAKTDLLGSISHELRSPLHGLLGCVELLEDYPQTAFQSEMLQSIEGCGRTLLDTIEQLLDFSKINNIASRRKEAQKQQHSISKLAASSQFGNAATRLDISTEEVVAAISIGFDAQRRTASQSPNNHRDDRATPANLPDSQDGTVTQVQSYSNHNGPTVILDVDKSMDMAFLTMPGSWRRIVMNLFANALKYTKSGHVKVTLASKPARPKSGSDMHHVIFTIVDTGQGFSADYLREKLFKPFAQEDSLASGTGLGLCIVKQIVDSCGGKIKVESVKNEGTKIVVSMHLQARRSETLHPREESKVEEVKELARLAQGRTACFLSLFKILDEPEQGVHEDMLEHALKRMLQHWFGFELSNEADVEHTATDVFLVVEPSAKTAPLKFSNIASLLLKISTKPNPILLVICTSLQSQQQISTASINMLPSSWIVQYVVQPFGVHRVAASLAQALKQQGKAVSADRRNPSDSVYIASRNSASAPSLMISSNPCSTSLELEQSSQEIETSFPKPTAPASSGLLATHPAPSRQASSKSFQETNTEDSRPLGLDDQPMAQRTASEFDSFLLVDDNPINLKILTAHAKRRKLPYMTADDGLKALETYKSDPSLCSVILMDISMPVMDGLESTRSIRAFEKQNRLKPSIIIVVTGLASADIQNETKLSGADAYLAKPVGLKELDEVIKGLKDRGSTEGDG